MASRAASVLGKVETLSALCGCHQPRSALARPGADRVCVGRPESKSRL